MDQRDTRSTSVLSGARRRQNRDAQRRYRERARQRSAPAITYEEIPLSALTLSYTAQNAALETFTVSDARPSNEGVTPGEHWSDCISTVEGVSNAASASTSAANCFRALPSGEELGDWATHELLPQELFIAEASANNYPAALDAPFLPQAMALGWDCTDPYPEYTPSSSLSNTRTDHATSNTSSFAFTRSDFNLPNHSSAEATNASEAGKNRSRSSVHSRSGSPEVRMPQDPQKMARELRELYAFGARVGLLPQDEEALAVLTVLEHRFRKLSIYKKR